MAHTEASLSERDHPIEIFAREFFRSRQKIAAEISVRHRATVFLSSCEIKLNCIDTRGDCPRFEWLQAMTAQRDRREPSRRPDGANRSRRRPAMKLIQPPDEFYG